VIKSRRIGDVGHKVRMGKRAIHIAFRLGNLKQRDRFENLGVDWIRWGQVGKKLWAVLNTVMNLLIPKSRGFFLLVEKQLCKKESAPWIYLFIYLFIYIPSPIPRLIIRFFLF
jgi:hypothetical protein